MFEMKIILISKNQHEYCLLLSFNSITIVLIFIHCPRIFSDIDMKCKTKKKTMLRQWTEPDCSVAKARCCSTTQTPPHNANTRIYTQTTRGSYAERKNSFNLTNSKVKLELNFMELNHCGGFRVNLSVHVNLNYAYFGIDNFSERNVILRNVFSLIF